MPKSTLLPSLSFIVFCILFSVTKICIILLMMYPKMNAQSAIQKNPVVV
ncbi:hypothetical protein C723_1772 [Christiangramia flava JLT2011]|uniref:Uncharacterized protein n=1 Tax=Christiangramia flava JLT2011 TaxID=1229726 RepID=A0A1L7I802_9FLAO|nr:hypothetical protein GRFL_3017 [Christiangramia flava JLT2011]OSS39226.1 hypothetical protein C723_1772 [Christiangramia flava JLT2011]